MVCSLILVGSIVSFFYTSGPSEDEVIIIISRGTSLKEVGKNLEKSGIVDEALLFTTWIWAIGAAENLKAGEYFFAPKISTADVAKKIINGETFKRKITIAEGLTSVQIIDLIIGTEGLEGDVPDNIKEGSLLPETYQYEWGYSRKELINRMKMAMEVALETIWNQRHDDLPFDSVNDALVLASIIERETALPEERPHISGVFINRLRIGMRLQSDPTVAYGLSRRVTDADPLTREELDASHPFNTYKHNGLPPGPISNPGMDSLMAAVNPIATSNLYFVADGKGGHVFSSTLEQHNINVSKYRDLRKNNE